VDTLFKKERNANEEINLPNNKLKGQGSREQM
jgi:hypothetical protein